MYIIYMSFRKNSWEICPPRLWCAQSLDNKPFAISAAIPLPGGRLGTPGTSLAPWRFGAVLPTKLGKTWGDPPKHGENQGKPTKNGGLMWIDVDFTCKKGGNNWANWDGWVGLRFGIGHLKLSKHRHIGKLNSQLSSTSMFDTDMFTIWLVVSNNPCTCMYKYNMLIYL